MNRTLLVVVPSCLLLSGCAVGKAYKTDESGQRKEVMVWGWDAGQISAGATAFLGELSENKVIAGVLGTLGGGGSLLYLLGGIRGRRKGERESWDEAKAEYESARARENAAYDEALARRPLGG